MGTHDVEAAATSTGLAQTLFTPVQQRVLALLFGRPGRRFQSAEVIRLADSGTGATHRLLSRLAASGLLRVTMQGRQKYYQANPDSPVFQELTGIVRKTVGLAEPLREALAPLADRIMAAFVFGSVARGEDRADSDIDVMVIADDLDHSTLFDSLGTAEGMLGRRISPTLLTVEDWRARRSRKGSLAARILEGPRLFLIGSEGDLP